MEKSTVLAKLRGKLEFTEQAQTWMHQLGDTWFAQSGGDALLSEFRGPFVEALKTVAEDEVDGYFAKLGIPRDLLPRVEVLETYRGSLIVDAAITMAGGMGTVYATLKAIAELPKVADGLEDLKKRIETRFQKKADDTARQIIQNQKALIPPPRHLLNTDFTIDARPLRALQPDVAKAHKIHLSVAISRSGLVLENLGVEPMRDVRIGIFNSPTQRNQWSLHDAFNGAVSLLSERQTISRRTDDFRDRNGAVLDLEAFSPAFVDCWIQDEHGIYLFNFYLD
jgi:hypothetical protein